MNITEIPDIEPAVHQIITYNDVTQLMANQMTDKFFYISLFLLFYIIMNMYVFREGARLRKEYDALCDKNKYPFLGYSVGLWLYEIIETVALAGAIVLVLLNAVYRLGVNV